MEADHTEPPKAIKGTLGFHRGYFFCFQKPLRLGNFLLECSLFKASKVLDSKKGLNMMHATKYTGNDMDSNIVIINDRLSLLALERGRQAAAAASTDNGRSRGGWIRLARIKSESGFSNTPYVIAIRAVASEERPVQFSCSCPGWMFHRGPSGQMCKHQRFFLRHTGGSSPKAGLWVYQAGTAFLQAIRGNFTWTATFDS